MIAHKFATALFLTCILCFTLHSIMYYHEFSSPKINSKFLHLSSEIKSFDKNFNTMMNKVNSFLDSFLDTLKKNKYKIFHRC